MKKSLVGTKSRVTSFLTALLLLGTSNTFGTQYEFTETINVSGTSILDLATDGSNFLILHNYSSPSGTGDKVKIVDMSGNLIHTFSTPSQYSSGITYNGSDIVFTSRGDTSYNTLWSMNPTTGSNINSDYRAVANSLAYDGENILLANYANGTNGILTLNINKVNSLTYTSAGSFSMTIDTGTNISATSVSGLGWHNDHIYVRLSGIKKVFQFDTKHNLVDEILIIPDGQGGITFIGDDMFLGDRSNQVIYHYSVVPEPATVMLLALGGLALRGRK